MTQKIEVITFFDCTSSGIKYYRAPHGKDHNDWHYKRNQQRNLDTVIQCISLRCQPLNITNSVVETNNEKQLFWSFYFETDKTDIFLKEDDPLGILKEDCHQIPMIVGLGESERELFFTPYLITLGSFPNTFFRLA